MGAMSPQALKIPQSFPRASGREVLTTGQAPVKQRMYLTVFHPHNEPRTCHLRLCSQIRTLAIKNVRPVCQPLLIYPFSNSLRYQKHNQGEAPVRTHLTFEGNLAGRSSAVNGKGGILFRFLKSCLFFAVFMLGCTGPSLLGADFLSLRTEGCTPSLCGPLIAVGPPLAEHRPPASGAAAPGFRSTGPQLQQRQPPASGAQAPSFRSGSPWLQEHRPPAHGLQEPQPRAQELKLGGSAAWTQQPPL